MKAAYMDVIVSIRVSLDDCKTVRDAYDKAERVAQQATEMLEPELEVDDWYEVPRNNDGDCEDWE